VRSQSVSELRSFSTFDAIFSDLLMPEMSGMDVYDVLTERYPDAAERA
jgi:CheY-like chemotaxis protein